MTSKREVGAPHPLLVTLSNRESSATRFSPSQTVDRTVPGYGAVTLNDVPPQNSLRLANQVPDVDRPWGLPHDRVTSELACLGGQSEPRSAAEVAASLTEAHPERAVQVAVVRNSLEQGVAQGLLERSKQGRSVFYSPTAPASVPSGS